MAFYNIDFKQSALKELKKIDKSISRSIFNKIEALSEEPHPMNCKKIRGSERSFRLRIGDYRVIYQVEHSTKQLTIYKIGHRKDVYRGL